MQPARGTLFPFDRTGAPADKESPFGVNVRPLLLRRLNDVLETLKRTQHLIVLAVSVTVAFVTTARADILHVPGDYLTIQAAIDAAVDGDEVEVHPGTYNETINFLGKAITVRSSGGAKVRRSTRGTTAI